VEESRPKVKATFSAKYSKEHAAIIGMQCKTEAPKVTWGDIWLEKDRAKVVCINGGTRPWSTIFFFASKTSA